MRDMNTAGLKSVAESKRDVKMGSSRPSYGRAGNYGTQGRIQHGRSGGLGPTKRKFMQLVSVHHLRFWCIVSVY